MPDFRLTTCRARRHLAVLGPGFLGVAGVVVLSHWISELIGWLSPLVASVGIAAVLSNLGLVPDVARPGLCFAAQRILRVGVALLGFQLALGQMLDLGAPGLAVVAAVVTATFFGTQWAGRRLGLSRDLSLLVATGYAICGASAIAAMDGVIEAEDEETAYAIGLVTLCGTLSIAALPALRIPLGLDAVAFGSWVGASVHDMGQAVATAATGGSSALKAGVVVKLTRVVLLAPIIAGVSLSRRRARARLAAPGTTGPIDTTDRIRKPALVPAFVVGFLAAAAIRSTGILPPTLLEGIQTLDTVLLAGALAGLGAGVDVKRLWGVGGRPLALGLGAWILVAGVSYLAVRLVGL